MFRFALVLLGSFRNCVMLHVLLLCFSDVFLFYALRISRSHKKGLESSSGGVNPTKMHSNASPAQLGGFGPELGPENVQCLSTPCRALVGARLKASESDAFFLYVLQ
jgi:hypothetical protein